MKLKLNIKLHDGISDVGILHSLVFFDKKKKIDQYQMTNVETIEKK